MGIRSTHHVTRPLQILGWLTAVIVLSATGVAEASAQPRPRLADGNPAGLMIRQSQSLYAYVGEGETLDVTVSKSRNTTATPDAPTTTTVRGPDGVIAGPCAISAAAAVGVSCAFTGLSAVTAGIWQISFDAGTKRATTDWYTWDISPRVGEQSLSGRVWSEGYLGVQPSGENAPRLDISLWYQQQFGFTYRGDFQNVQGIDSLFAADATGNHGVASCVPIYRSVDFPPPPGVARDNAGCGAYKIFFAPPAATLPATATRWDGVTDWVKPPEAAPVLDDLHFTYGDASTLEGIVGFTVHDMLGPLSVEIDANDDGDFTDAVDRAMPHSVEREGEQLAAFDGKDGMGEMIARVRPIRIRVTIDRVGEIHLVNGDVEGRGGLRLTRLAGTGSRTSQLYWNDSELDPDRQRSNGCGATELLDGRAGVDSTPGVHGWATCLTGWGNERAIDDWTYEKLSAPIASEIRLAGAPLVITKRANVDVAAPGEKVEYVVTIRNLSRWPVSAIAPVPVTDDLTGALDDADYNSDATATAGEVSYAAPNLTWIGPVDGLGSVRVTYSLTIHDPDAGDHVVRDVVTAEGTGCDLGCASVTIVSPPAGYRRPVVGHRVQPRHGYAPRPGYVHGPGHEPPPAGSPARGRVGRVS